MRLIDADDLLNKFNPDSDILIDNIIARIRIVKQPTAYDIDKVVAELNELDVTAIRRYEGGTFGNYEGTDYYIEKSKAIEIVKQGGISDDVCEWKSDCHLENDNPAKWLISPHKPKKIFSTDIKYCPYCGKKIKVVDR